MPCGDVTEVLRVIIDKDDRISGYALNKRTCGGGIGDRSLIHSWVEGRCVQEIADYSTEDFFKENKTDDIVQEFLQLKHFFALQHCLRVFLGVESGDPKSSCAVDRILYTPNGIELTAEIKVDVLVSQIQSCGSCGSCGSKNPAMARKHQNVCML